MKICVFFLWICEVQNVFSGQTDGETPVVIEQSKPTSLRDRLHSTMKRLKRLQTINHRLLTNNRRLQISNRKLSTKLKAQKKELTYLQNPVQSVALNKLFCSQAKLAKYEDPRGRRYSEYDRNWALASHYLSSSCYRMLEKTLILPSERSLSNWLSRINMDVGLNQDVLKFFEGVIKNWPLEERVISLVLDEVSLKENVTFSAPSDIFYGFTQCGCDGKHKLERANQGLVLMIKGVKQKFKQVIGYYLAKDAAKGECQKDIVVNAIKKLQDTGFVVKVVVSDQGTNNVKMRILLGVTCEKPYTIINDQKVYFLWDAPHLIKSVRNNLKSHDFILNGNLIRWKHVNDFCRSDLLCKPRLAPRITLKHLNLPPFSPMRVGLAIQLLSHSVSSGMKTYINLNNVLPQDATPTAEFVEDMDKLFDVFNSSVWGTPKKWRKPLYEDSHHWEHLTKMKSVLENLQYVKISKKKAENGTMVSCTIELSDFLRIMSSVFIRVGLSASIRLQLLQKLSIPHF